jgi:hypothetical protein
MGTAPLKPKRTTTDRMARWFSAPVIVGLLLLLALLFAFLVISARSTTAAGVIAPDWGLASLRIGLAAVLVGGLLLVSWLCLWRLQRRPAPPHGAVAALLLVLVGAAGMLGAAPLDRLQGRWFEGQGQYGLALAAYQLSGDTLATSQDMARISIEWAKQLSARQAYADAIPQLEAVVLDYNANTAPGAQARLALIQDYLAWGDQARQQQDFSDALARYRAVQQADYCTASCQMQVHTRLASALLGWAQQLTAKQQYAAAIAAYEQLVQDYSDTPESQEAEQALTAPQPLMGHLIYEDKTPAAHFQVLLASQWTFDTTTQVFALSGVQYTAQTDASGLFTIPLVMVGNTYLIAWIDPAGHGGTCKTTNNQPLYKVQVPPLRADDVGAIDIDCV